MRETRASKAGIVLAMMYAITVTPKVQPSQESQWVGVMLFKCGDPRRRWTKMYFAGIYRQYRLVGCAMMFWSLWALHV